MWCYLSGTENDTGSVKKEKEKKNRKKDKENGSNSGEAGDRKDIDAPDAVVCTFIKFSSKCKSFIWEGLLILKVY